MKPLLTKPAKLDALTGMRFVAAYVVMLQHLDAYLDLPIVTVPLGGLFGRESWKVDLGMSRLSDSAVSFFFVLSGFVLAYNYEGKLESSVGAWRRFWVQRFARIFPLHLVTLLAMLALISREMNLLSFGISEWLQFGLHLFLIQAWIPIAKVAFAFNGVAWSISCECFFYFLFPWLLALGKRLLGFCFALLGTSVLAYALLDRYFAVYRPVTEIEPVAFSHTFPPARLLEFASGILVGRYFLSRPLSDSDSAIRATGWEAAVLVFFLISHNLANDVIRLTIRQYGQIGALTGFVRFSGELGVFLLATIVFARGKGLFSKLLSSRLLVYLGEISFSLYLCHTVVFLFFRQQQLFQSQYGFWMDFVTVNLFVLAASSLLYHLVEIPAKRQLLDLYEGRERLGTRWLLRLVSPLVTVRVALSATLLAGLLLFSSATRGLPRMVEESIPPRIFREIAEGSPPKLQGVNFENRVRFLGYRGELSAEELKIGIVYRLLGNRTEETGWILEAVDDGGQRLATFGFNRTFTITNGGSTRCLSRFLLTPPKELNRFHVAVSLREQVELGGDPAPTVRVQNPPAVLAGNKLILGTFDRQAIEATLPASGQPLLMPFNGGSAGSSDVMH